jgi:cytochrome d ubiquinol oxidase subunit I
MDHLLLARWQFAITSAFHFIFVPLTLGLVWVVAAMHTAWIATGDESWKKATKFWGKLFVLNVAVGVPTGIVLEFQLGMNWSEFSRFAGDVIGAPLAVEALLSFFIESTFLGLWIFGWDRVPRIAHLCCIWMVAIGSVFSAFWILVANSFMHHPVGYVLRDGRLEMTDFWAVVTNAHLFVQFPHVMAGGLATAGFFVLGVSAWQLNRRTDALNRAAFTRSFRIGAVYALVATLAVIVAGHAQAQAMARTEPMKLASAEALWTTESPAAMSLFTWGNEPEKRDVWAVRVPGLLSFLAYNRFDGEVKGVKELQAEYERQFGPGDYTPPIKWTYWTFRTMAGAGFLMLALSGWAVFGAQRGLIQRPAMLNALTLAVALPYVANGTGWIFTETGRAPWVIFGLQKIERAVSPNVPGSSVAASLAVFVRSEERRVGKECKPECRSRWSPYH